MSHWSPAPRLALALWCLVGVGCAHNYYVFPGPLASVGKPALPVGFVDDDGPGGSVWDGIEPTAAVAATNAGATPESGSARDAEPPVGLKARKRGGDVAKSSTAFLGASKLRHRGESFRYDCSGLVMAAHARAGLQLAGSSESMLTMAKEVGVFHRRKRPRVGDVAFFANTYDKNGNGRLDDLITHVAVVVEVDEDGTVHMVHKGGRGITRLILNLHQPSEHADGASKEINSYLRSRRSSDRRGTRYLAGELWIGFASFWRVLEPR